MKWKFWKKEEKFKSVSCARCDKIMDDLSSVFYHAAEHIIEDSKCYEQPLPPKPDLGISYIG